MSLSPYTRASFAETAAIKAKEAARLFEAAGLYGLAHDSDEIARKALAEAERISAAEDARLASEEAEIAAWEARDGRQFDAWVQSATDAEIEASLTTRAPLMRSVGEIQQATGTQ